MSAANRGTLRKAHCFGKSVVARDQVLSPLTRCSPPGSPVLAQTFGSEIHAVLRGFGLLSLPSRLGLGCGAR